MDKKKNLVNNFKSLMGEIISDMVKLDIPLLGDDRVYAEHQLNITHNKLLYGTYNNFRSIATDDNNLPKSLYIGTKDQLVPTQPFTTWFVELLCKEYGRRTGRRPYIPSHLYSDFVSETGKLRDWAEANYNKKYYRRCYNMLNQETINRVIRMEKLK